MRKFLYSYFFRNLPRAIVISMAIVTSLFALVNLSYLTVMGLDGVSASEAVAVVTFLTIFLNNSFLAF